MTYIIGLIYIKIPLIIGKVKVVLKSKIYTLK